MRALTLAPSPLGGVGVAAVGEAIAGVLLPEPTDDATLERLAWLLERRFGAPFDVVAEPDGPLAEAVRRIQAHLEGAHDDLRSVALDYTGLSAFRRRVSEAARAIPIGEVRTYGALAREVESPGASRAVGRAMGQNPFAVIVPCHRVVGASSTPGKIAPGGFSAHGGLLTKSRLLTIERAASAAQILPA